MIRRPRNTELIFDARWGNPHGIGRMAAEIRRRCFQTATFVAPRWPKSPLSPIDPFVRGIQLLVKRNAAFYSPGFNAPVFAQRRVVFTICDLIHLRVAGEADALKRLYYDRIVKPAVSRCFRVLTVSEYSKRDVLDWSGAAESQIVNVGCGVDAIFFEQVQPWQPGFPYFFYVGARKPHKNLDRLIEAYARSRAAKDIRLVLSGSPDAQLLAKAARLGVADRLVFAGLIPEVLLPTYYRGAVALLFPSTFEGFGLPPVEAMAGGTPVLTSNETSMPEVVGDAALKVDTRSVDDLCNGIDLIAFDDVLRSRLAEAGPPQARRHSWDAVAEKVGEVIAELRDSV